MFSLEIDHKFRKKKKNNKILSIIYLPKLYYFKSFNFKSNLSISFIISVLQLVVHQL